MSVDRMPAQFRKFAEPAFHWRLSKLGAALLPGVGSSLAIFILAKLSLSLEQMLLIAPFGATCVLLFALPQSPLARPRNVIGGHCISGLAGLIMLYTLGTGALACGLSVGLSIVAMQVTKTIHPPAGGTPLVILMLGAKLSFIVLPVLVVTAALVGFAIAWHRWVSGERYPT